MEVVSTSNLVSSENEKITTNLCHEFFCYATWFDERQNMKLCIYVNMKLFLVSWWQNCKRHDKKHIHKTAKSKSTSNKLKEKNCFTLKIHYFYNNLIRVKKVDRSISCKTTNKPDENLVRGRGRGRQLEEPCRYLN